MASWFQSTQPQSTAESSSCCDPFKSGNRDKTNEVIDHDAALAKEMNELTVEEREQVLDDIHGVAEVHNETTEFIEGCLRRLDEALNRIPSRKRKNWNQALFLCPKLETDTKFKLMFLRADLYDAVRAADRIVQHYDFKCELFGEENLVKRITIMDDLTEEDIESFMGGFHVELPFKDQSGRPLLFVDTTKLNFDRMSPEAMVRRYDVSSVHIMM
jgi:hypothetical protein